MVIGIAQRSTETADYLIVTTRSSCILYLLCSKGIVRLTAYILNNVKSIKTNASLSKVSQNLRVYFM